MSLKACLIAVSLLAGVLLAAGAFPAGSVSEAGNAVVVGNAAAGGRVVGVIDGTAAGVVGDVTDARRLIPILEQYI